MVSPTFLSFFFLFPPLIFLQSRVEKENLSFLLFFFCGSNFLCLPSRWSSPNYLMSVSFPKNLQYFPPFVSLGPLFCCSLWAHITLHSLFFFSPPFIAYTGLGINTFFFSYPLFSPRSWFFHRNN